MRTRIKICCIGSIAEAKLALEYGADAIGLVGKMPSGPGPIPDNSPFLLPATDHLYNNFSTKLKSEEWI